MSSSVGSFLESMQHTSPSTTRWPNKGQRFESPGKRLSNHCLSQFVPDASCPPSLAVNFTAIWDCSPRPVPGGSCRAQERSRPHMNIADLATKVFSGRMWKHKDVHPKALGEMQPIEGGMSVPQVTMRGNPVTLVGDEVKVGDKARDFTVVANDLSTVSLNDTSGVRIFRSVPSLDTGVCDAEVPRFNEVAASLECVKVYTISMDLPFAQARWCGAAGVENVVTLSDHRDASFGQNWG